MPARGSRHLHTPLLGARRGSGSGRSAAAGVAAAAAPQRAASELLRRGLPAAALLAASALLLLAAPSSPSSPSSRPGSPDAAGAGGGQPGGFLARPALGGAVAFASGGGASSFFRWIVFLVVIAACIVAGALAFQAAVVRLVHSAIEHFDRDYLGVDVTIRSVTFNLFTARLAIRGLHVNNPEGFSDKGLLNAATFVLDLNMARALKTLGREVEVTELKVLLIDLHVERNGFLWAEWNFTTLLENLKNSVGRPKGSIQPVYDYWHAGNNEHTFHCDPAWGGEVRKDVQFFAYTEQAPNTEPVYHFWQYYYQEHDFRMGDAGGITEKKGDNPVFYLFKEQAPGTEPVYCYWHTGNKEHTVHFEPAWPMEEKQGDEARFFAYRTDPTGKSSAAVGKPKILPVYDFWHSGQGQHTFHFLPKWGGESGGNIQFYCYDKQVEGTEPVWDFWHAGSGKKRFHLGEAAEGEARRSPLFYVFTEQARGTEPVYEFYHEGNNEYNLHFGEPWDGEERREVKFYAYSEDPAERKKMKIFLKKVCLNEIKVASSIKSVGMNFTIDDMNYEDFSEKFEATTPSEIVHSLLGELWSKVSFCLGG